MKESQIYKDKSLCTGCEMCADLCPKHAITMTADWRGFRYPKVNNSLCIDCNLCHSKCPTNKPATPEFEFESASVFVESNLEYLNRASSGGAMGVLARYVFSKGGVVFGASMSETYDVTIIKAENIEELKAIHGSKYVQAYAGNCYSEIKKYLLAGRWVLFCACPCQVAALNSYLGKTYDNLITADLICHGVPSQPYFKSYVKDILKRYKKVGVEYFRFRHKTAPMQKIQPLDISSIDNNVYVGYYNKDYYMAYFLWGKGYRESCYKCRYPGHEREGDFTIGDFGQNKKMKLPIDVLKGTSLVLPNNGKAKSLMFLFNDGQAGLLDCMENAVGKDGSHLKHPSKYDIRCKMIYYLYWILGVKGPRFLFKLDNLRRRK